MRKGWTHNQQQKLFLSNSITANSRKIHPHRDIKCPPTKTPPRPPRRGVTLHSWSHVPLRDMLHCGSRLRISQARPSAGSRRREGQHSAEEKETEVRSAPSAAQETRTWLHLHRTDQKETFRAGINLNVSALRAYYLKVKMKCAAASSVWRRRHAQSAKVPLSTRLCSLVLDSISCTRWDFLCVLTCPSPIPTKYCILNEYNV